MVNNGRETKIDIMITEKLKIIFILSMLSNIGGILKGSQKHLEELIKLELDVALDLVKGKWKLFWGPGVFQGPLSKILEQPDNVMFMAKGNFDGETTPQYVISIAGSLTIYDYIIEDFWVTETEPWRYSSSEQELKISKGTNIALNHLLNMAPEPLKINLRECLSNITSETDEKVHIIVAGHSLGGALAYTLALYLFDTQSSWNIDNRATVYSYPFAAPAIGDSYFATYYDQKLGSRTTRVWNSIDMIPHLWHKSCLEKIPKLYEPYYPPNKEVCDMVKIFEQLSKNTKYSHIMASVAGLPGTIKEIDRKKWDEYEKFMYQVYIQHTDEYFRMLFGKDQITDIIEHLQTKAIPGFEDFMSAFKSAYLGASALWLQESIREVL